MIVLFKGQKNKNILIFDAEYNEGTLIQFSGLLFKSLDNGLYQISKSLNIYVKLKNGRINNFIRAFTGITDEFLDSNGITIKQAQQQIQELLDVDDLLVVSHGLYNDRQIMLDNGVDMYLNSNEEEIIGICSYKMAKRILDRDKHLTLKDVAMDAGLFLSNDHNAFDDAWATVAVFSLLNKLEEERKNDERE